MKPWLFIGNYMMVIGMGIFILPLLNITTPPFLILVLALVFIRAGVDANLFGIVNRWIEPFKRFGININEPQYITVLIRQLGNYSDLERAEFYERKLKLSTINYRVFQGTFEALLVTLSFVIGGIPLVIAHILMTLFGVQDYFYHIAFGNIQTMGESHYDEAPWMWWTIFGMFCTISRVRIPRKIVVLQAWIGILVLIGYGLFFV